MALTPVPATYEPNIWIQRTGRSGYAACTMFCHARETASELAELAEDSDREPLPLHRRKVVEEDCDRVEDRMDHWRSVADAGLEVSASSTATASEVAAAEAHSPAEVAAAAVSTPPPSFQLPKPPAVPVPPQLP